MLLPASMQTGVAVGRRALCSALLLAASILPAHAADFQLPEGPGANLVYAKCRTCHDLQYVVDAKGLVPAQWRAVIASMHDYGLTATKEEDAALLQYLGTYLGPTPPPGTAPAASTADAADGGAIYAQNCATCHGPKGRGQPGAFPPLAGNPDLVRDDGTFPASVVLHGMDGAIDVAGSTYNSPMPPFGHLSNAEVAAVVNYVREAFGNAGPAPGITADGVARQRAKAMTPAQVHAYRAKVGGK